MSRMIKALGLSALALCLLGAFASVASAEVVQELTSSSPNNKTTLTITQDGTEGTTTAHQVFKIQNAAETKALSITCNGVHAEYTFEGTKITEATIVPSYTNCKFNGVNVTVNMGGCAYTVEANGNVQVVNAAGKNCTTEPINFSGNGCQVKVAAQSGIEGHITAHNEAGTPMTITGEIENNSTHPKKIQYTQTGVACPESGKQLTNGTYETGNITITGFEDLKPGQHGSQVDVTVS